MSSCSHIIIQDSVDITPDKSVSVYYCHLCYACFSLEQLSRIESVSDPIYRLKWENPQSDSEHP